MKSLCWRELYPDDKAVKAIELQNNLLQAEVSIDGPLHLGAGDHLGYAKDQGLFDFRMPQFGDLLPACSGDVSPRIAWLGTKAGRP